MPEPDLNQIKNLCKDRNLTQQLAGILLISQCAYLHYESGTRGIPLDILSALADHYGCSMDYLLSRTKKKSTSKYSLVEESLTDSHSPYCSKIC